MFVSCAHEIYIRVCIRIRISTSCINIYNMHKLCVWCVAGKVGKSGMTEVSPVDSNVAADPLYSSWWWCPQLGPVEHASTSL